MMKNLVMAIGLLALSAGVQAVDIDLSEATCETTGATTVTFDNVYAPLWDAYYWLDVQWNATANVFQVTGYGETIEACPSVTGDWNLNFDWFCDGAPGTATISFYEDGTFVTNDGGVGTWEQTDCAVDWYFDNYNTHYWGDMDPSGDFMSGEMDGDGSPGCWDADRIGGAAERVMSPATDGGLGAAGNLE